MKFEFCSVTFLLKKYKINTADFSPSESRDPNFINMPRFLNQEISWCLVMKKSSFMFRHLRYVILILIYYYDFQIQFLPRPFSAGSLLSSPFTLKLFVKRQTDVKFVLFWKKNCRLIFLQNLKMTRMTRMVDLHLKESVASTTWRLVGEVIFSRNNL